MVLGFEAIFNNLVPSSLVAYRQNSPELARTVTTFKRALTSQAMH